MDQKDVQGELGLFKGIVSSSRHTSVRPGGQWELSPPGWGSRLPGVPSVAAHLGFSNPHHHPQVRWDSPTS